LHIFFTGRQLWYAHKRLLQCHRALNVIGLGEQRGALYHKLCWVHVLFPKKEQIFETVWNRNFLMIFFFIFFFKLLKKNCTKTKRVKSKQTGTGNTTKMSEPKHGQAAELPRMVDTAAFASPMQVRLLIWLHCW
jgi:hypothetical protein